MCGILGFYLNRPLNENDIKKGKKALKIQEHRGPDNTGIWFDIEEGIFLGHNRLSIIDLNKAANQPMEREYCFNLQWGNIYYRQLKEKFFNKRTQFYSRSDSEVLLKLWNLRHESFI